MANTVNFQSTEAPLPKGAKVLFKPHPGQQTKALLAPWDEILIGGSKAGGKTKICQAFILKGNPDQDPQANEANISYVFHGGYRALVIRRNYKDMTDWLDTAVQFYEDNDWPQRLRAKYNKDDQYFKWPSGARCYVDHFATTDAYNKQKGRNVLHRLVVEELTDTCPVEDGYWQFMSCLRSLSSTPELRCQVMCSTNPEGAGLNWVKARFMTDPETGRMLEPETVIRQEIVSPLSGKRRTTTRVFIPFKVTDNPSVDPNYEFTLAGLPEHMRLAYLEGRWDMLGGSTFFPEFRQEQKPNEPQGAVHVIEPEDVQFEDWETTIASLDWGFTHKAVFLFGTEKSVGKYAGRFIIREELIFRKKTDEEMGRLFATEALKYLSKENHVLQLFVPPEIFSKYSEVSKMESIAGRLQVGIEQVLGEDAVKILQKDGDFMTQLDLQRSLKIIMRSAMNQRVHGWGTMRQMLDWSMLDREIQTFDRDYAVKLATKDSLAYIDYLKRMKKIEEEAAQPRLLFLRGRTVELVDGIKRAVFSKKGQDMMKEDANPNTGVGGDDAVDSCRYLCVGIQGIRAQEPREVWLQKQLDAHKILYGDQTPNARMLLVEKFERDYKGGRLIPFKLRRSRAS